VIPLKLNLNKDKEYARLKKIGNVGGADDAKKSIALKNTKTFSMSLSNKRYNIANNVIILTKTTSKTNMRVVLRMSGSLIVLLRIFLRILPL
jgi:hypothetical protein